MVAVAVVAVRVLMEEAVALLGVVRVQSLLKLVVPALVRQGDLGAQEVRLRVYHLRAQAPAVQVVAEVRRVQRVLVVVQLPLLPALRAVLLVTIL
jgi:hypothetical protein